jgi:TonB family protein
MKYVITIVTFLLFPIFMMGQKIYDTVYFDAKWKETIKKNHVYFRITEKQDNGKFKCLDYLKTGEIQMIGFYSSINPEIKDGEFIWYFKTGIVKEISHFIDGKPSELSKKFKTDGTLDLEYADLDILDNAKEINSTIPKFISFAHRKIKYPESSRKAGIEGQVNVAFYINQDGLPFRIAVTKSVNKEIDEEAIRVIKLYKWPPPIYKAEKTMILVILPVTFTLL